jgi:hypothetical protein
MKTIRYGTLPTCKRTYKEALQQGHSVDVWRSQRRDFASQCRLGIEFRLFQIVEVTQLPFVTLLFFRNTHATQNWTLQSNFTPRLMPKSKERLIVHLAAFLVGTVVTIS